MLNNTDLKNASLLNVKVSLLKNRLKWIAPDLKVSMLTLSVATLQLLPFS